MKKTAIPLFHFIISRIVLLYTLGDLFLMIYERLKPQIVACKRKRNFSCNRDLINSKKKKIFHIFTYVFLELRDMILTKDCIGFIFFWLRMQMLSVISSIPKKPTLTNNQLFNRRICTERLPSLYRVIAFLNNLVVFTFTFIERNPFS